MPAVSPDGRWLAFVSARSGNADIWVQSLENGKTVQVTNHQAEDVQPAWLPDGRHLVFVSKRRDAQGDLWITALDMKGGGIPKGKPRQLTDYLGADRDPSPSPDGKAIVFTSDRDGTPNLWILDLDSGHSHQFTKQGGFSPSWSPNGEWILFTSCRYDAGGDLFLMHESQPESGELAKWYAVTWDAWIDTQAGWSPDGRSIVFTRYDQDTDGDGKVTPADNGSLWIKSLSQQGVFLPQNVVLGRDEIQITTELFKDSEPAWGRNHVLYFTSRRGYGVDIWSIPEQGLFSRCNSAVDQYSLVLDTFGEAETTEALFQSLLGYQRVLDYFPADSLWAAKALIQMGEIEQMLHREEKAKECYEHVIRRYPGRVKERSEAELKIAGMGLEPYETRIQKCHELIERYSGESYTAAEAWIVLGDLYAATGKTGQSLAAYGQVIQKYPQLLNLKASAEIKIGDALSGDGQDGLARQTYLSLLREFKDVPLWRKRAVDRILAQVAGTLIERIVSYRQIIQQGRDVPSLVAETQLSIARALIDSMQYRQALVELDQVQVLAPELPWADADAKLLKARVYGKMEDELYGILLLEEVMDSYADLEGGRYAWSAREDLFTLLFTSAQRLKGLGDYRLAESRYRKALEIKPDHVQAHWGLVETVYLEERRLAGYKGALNALIREYEIQLSKNPDEAVLQAGLGLAYSYRGEKNAELLKKSNATLSGALAKNDRLIPAYNTLGYNYEELEKLEEEQRKKPVSPFVRFGRSLASPAKRILESLSLAGRERKEEYYEKAIQALLTGTELNDEDTDPQMEAKLTQNLANNFYHLGEFGYKKAFHYYQTRLSLDSTFSSPEEKALFFERAGYCGAFSGDRRETAKFLGQAIQIYADLKKETAVTRNLKILAFHYQLMGDHETAVDVYKDILERDSKTGSWLVRVMDLRNIAYHYTLMEEPEDALLYLRQAEAILDLQEIPIRPSKKNALRVEILGLSIPVWSMEELGGASAEGFTPDEELALVYRLASSNLEMLKNFPAAIEYENKRLEIFRQKKDVLAERMSLNRLGVLYYQLPDFDRSWEYFRECWEKSKKKKDAQGRWVGAVNMGNVAIVELENRNRGLFTGTAIACLEEELMQPAAAGEMQTRSKRVLSGMLGALWMLKAEFDTPRTREASGPVVSEFQRIEALRTARDYFRDALRLARDEKNEREQGILLKNIAEAATLCGEDSIAMDWMKESYTLLRSKGEEDLLWRLMYGLAGLWSRNPRLYPAFLAADSPSALYEKAMDLLETLPVQAEGSEERLSDRLDRRQLYVDAAVQMAREGQPLKALEISERGREKLVADMIARRPPPLERERHKIAWANLRYLRSRYAETRKRILNAEMEKRDFSELDSLENVETATLKEYRERMIQIRDEDPVLAYMAGAFPVSSARFQDLPDSETVFLEYLLCGEKTLLWIVEKDTIRLFDLDAHSDSLEHHINRIQETMKGSAPDDASGWLCQRLLAPAEEVLHRKSRWVIIPDGILGGLPFEMLPFRGDPVIQNKRISYAPSLAYYALASQRRRMNQERGLLAGDPKDAGFISALAKGTAAAVSLLGQEASEYALKQNAPKADVIHLGRWIIVHPENPLTSAVALFSDGREDGFLEAEELFSWSLNASMVFLPPSTGGSADIWTGNQFFFYGLLYAGVPTVLSPVGSVPREVQEKLAALFYSGIERYSAAEALSEAQRALYRDGYPPRDWAAFRLVGFCGMDTDERMQYAASHLMEMVRMGYTYGQRQEFPDAVNTLERALHMAMVIGDSSRADRVRQLIVQYCVSGQMWSKAADYQTQIMQDAEKKGETEEVRLSLNNLAIFYMRSGQLQKAASLKQAYIERFLSEESPVSLASGYEDLAFIYEAYGNFSEASAWADEAYRLYRSREDVTSQGRALVLKGRFELENDRYWQAKELLLEGVGMLEGVAREDSSQWVQSNLAAGLQLVGLACEKLSKYSEALEYQRESLALFERLNQGLEAAQARQYMANVFWMTGEYRNALLYEQKALEGFEKAGNKKQLIMAYNTQALIQMSLGEKQKADEAFRKSLRLAEETGNRADQSSVLKNMGSAAMLDEDFGRAADHFFRAAGIDSALGYSGGLANDYRQLGGALTGLGRLSEAIAFLRKGLSLSKEIGDVRNSIHCCYHLGDAYAAAGEYGMALAILDSGLAAVSGISLPDLAWRLHRKEAHVFVELGKDDEALAHFKEAIRIVEALRTELKVEALQQGFLESKMVLYVDVIDQLLRMNRPQEAFDFSERAKSRSFIDMLGNQTLVLNKAGNEALGRERALREAVYDAQNRLSWYSLKTTPLTPVEEEERRNWGAELIKRREAFQSVLDSVQLDNPELASLLSVDPWKLSRIQSLLPDSTLLVEYFVTDEATTLWSVSRENIEVKRTAGGNVMEEKIRQFRTALESHLSFEEESRTLYQWLIEPFEKSIDEAKHLVIVPHGILHYVPFAALEDAKKAFLIEKVSLSYAPSSTVLGYCLEKGDALSREKRKRVLALGNPDLGGTRFNLEYAEKEVLTLRRVFNDVDSFFGKEATEEVIRRHASEYDVLHFACHGVFEAAGPLFSAVLLSPDDQDDGRLEAHEIFGLTLRSELVTLSACESGLSHITAGDEIVGLTRSFLFAGTPSILTSLWKVEDLSTAVMIKRFYRYWDEGNSKAESLRLAQILVKNNVNSHPGAWAAFCITGDFR